MHNTFEWFTYDSHARVSEGMVDGKGKSVLPKSGAVPLHIKELQGLHASDSSLKVLVLKKFQR